MPVMLYGEAKPRRDYWRMASCISAGRCMSKSHGNTAVIARLRSLEETGELPAEIRNNRAVNSVYTERRGDNGSDEIVRWRQDPADVVVHPAVVRQTLVVPSELVRTRLPHTGRKASPTSHLSASDIVSRLDISLHHIPEFHFTLIYTDGSSLEDIFSAKATTTIT